MTLIADVFLTLWPRNTWLEKFLKSHVLEDPSVGNMVNGLKQCSKLNDSTFTMFIDLCEGKSKENPVEKNSLSDMQNHRTVC